MNNMPQEEKEFLIQQYYKVTPSAPSIDTSDDLSKRGTEMEHRLFQAIVADKQAIQDVLEYRVIIQHGVKSSSEEELLKDHYGKELTFAHILDRHSHLFTPEDRAWVQGLIKDRPDDIWEQLETLEDCFKVEPSGWNIQMA